MSIADLCKTCKFDVGTKCILHSNEAEFIRLAGHTFVADAGQEPAVKTLLFKVLLGTFCSKYGVAKI